MTRNVPKQAPLMYERGLFLTTWPVSFLMIVDDNWREPIRNRLTPGCRRTAKSRSLLPLPASNYSTLIFLIRPSFKPIIFALRDEFPTLSGAADSGVKPPSIPE